MIQQMHKRGAAALIAALVTQPIMPLFAAGADTTPNVSQTKDAAAALKTASPIKHVIILIGENRGLDHTFGVYTPKGSGQTISNLLSKGIVNEDGTPGPHFAQAQQFRSEEH